MNVRRINATRNVRIMTKIIIIVLLIFLFLVVSVQNSVCPAKNTIKWKFWQQTVSIPLSNYTCDEIYYNSLNGTLYKDNKQRKFEYEQVFLYYIKNCINNRVE